MIFVTGGTGLVGSQLLFDLMQDQKKVRALYRSEGRLNRVAQFFNYRDPKNGAALFDQIEWVEGDLLDIPSLEDAIKDCTHVYHCAALVSFHPADFNQLFKINREGTENVVNICLSSNIEKLCYVSSTAAVGGDNTEVITEKTKWKNGSVTSGYSLSKYAAEREVWRAIEEGLNAVMVNPSVIFGPGNWNESSLAIFSTVEKGLKHYPPGSNATVDVRDVSKSMISLMESDISGERFLCVGSNQSFLTLMTEIAGQMKISAPTKLAARWQVNTARILLGIVKGITRQRSSITKETVKNLFSDKSYSSAKLQEATGIEFTPLKEQVRDSIEGRLHS